MSPDPAKTTRADTTWWPISVDLHVTGETLPRVFSCSSWAAAQKFLASAEFREVADRVTFLTITNRDAP